MPQCDDVLHNVPMETDVADGCEAPTVTDKEFLLRLLIRTDEVELSQQVGQGRREAQQCKRQAAQIFAA